MNWRKRRPAPVRVVQDGEAAIIQPMTLFRLAPDHPMRAAPCLVCRIPVEDHAVTVAGVVLVGGYSCWCGSLPAELFLIHAGHLPVTRRDVVARVRSAVINDHDHDWAAAR